MNMAFARGEEGLGRLDLRCCVPNCKNKRADTFLHAFPNPETEPDRFRTWLHAVGGDILALKNEKIHRDRKVCRFHFETRFHSGKRLTTTAVPTLNLPVTNQPSSANIYEPTTSRSPINTDTNIDLDLNTCNESHQLTLDFGIPEDDPPVLGQTGQIESSINVDTGEEEVLETEEIVYEDGYRCPSPEVVEKEIPKVLPVLCVKCSQLIETHLYVCASCSDSQYEPLCATCAEHAALDAHAACYVLRARVTRPKTEIRGVLCAIRSELAMKSFADDLEDAITDIKSETADIPEDTAVLDVDPFNEIDSAVAVSAEGDPKTSLTTSDNEDTDDSSLDVESTASNADRIDQDLLSPNHELDTTTENEVQKTLQQISLLLPKPRIVVYTIHVQTPSWTTSNSIITLRGDDIEPKSQVPAPKGIPVSVRVQSESDNLQSRSSIVTGSTGLKRLQENIENSTDIKKAKSNIPQHRQQRRTKLITVKKRVKISQKDVQMATKNVQMMSKGGQNIQMASEIVQLLPKEGPISSQGVIAENFSVLPVDVPKKPLMTNMAVLNLSLEDNNDSESLETGPKATDYTSPDGTLTMKLKTFEKLLDQLRDCKVVLKDLKLPP